MSNTDRADWPERLPAMQSLSLREIRDWLAQQGEPSYRAKQIFSWIHGKQVREYDSMTNLPKKLRSRMAECFDPAPLRAVRRQVSQIDGTNKFLYELRDGQCIETVFMPYKHGNSVCVSSQAGCAMGCTFCASTIGGKVRDLTRGEILAQVYETQRLTGEPVSNCVIMGTGEPLDNVEEVIGFIRLLSDKDGQNMSLRNITLSTCGIVPGIYRLAQENMPITLALSLHAPTQEKREKLMPIARRYPLDEVMKACDDYYETTGRRETFEYALVAGVNDTDEDARELISLLKGRHAHVNLIPVNPVVREPSSGREGRPGSGPADGNREKQTKTAYIGGKNRIRRPDHQHVVKFQNKLEKNGINGTIRREMGADIDGACGQLRRRQAAEGSASGDRQHT